MNAHDLMSYNFISYVDTRHSALGISLKEAEGLFRYHSQIFGEGRCHIESDSVEVEIS